MPHFFERPECDSPLLNSDLKSSPQCFASFTRHLRILQQTGFLDRLNPLADRSWRKKHSILSSVDGSALSVWCSRECVRKSRATQVPASTAPQQSSSASLSAGRAEPPFTRAPKASDRRVSLWESLSGEALSIMSMRASPSMLDCMQRQEGTHRGLRVLIRALSRLAEAATLDCDQPNT